MNAYELLPKLQHLALSGQNADGELEWIGSRREWDLADNLIKAHEIHSQD